MNIQIIPAIDVLEGQAVRLTQGDYKRLTVYSKNPLDVAKQFEDCGVRRLHMVDLEGAKGDFPSNLHVLETVAAGTDLEIQYGGGLKNEDALQSVFNAGAARAICGSIAVKNPGLFAEWLERFGAAKLILGADVRQGKVAVKGWLEDSSVTIDDLMSQYPAVTQMICTDIARDGMLCGPSISFYQELQQRHPSVDITVSGGISDMSDIISLDNAGLRSVIVGKAYYEGRITLTDIAQCLQNE